MFRTSVILRRSAALAGAVMLLAGAASAEVVLKLKSGAGEVTLTATGVSVNLSRQPQWDYETGNPVPGSETLSTGPLYINRTTDEGTATVVESIVSGKTWDSIEVIQTDSAGDAGPATVWTAQDAVLNNYSSYSSEQDKPAESFDISFTRASFAYYPADARTGARAKTPTSKFTWSGVPNAQNGD